MANNRGHQFPERTLGLLGNDTVAERSKLGASRQPKVSDVAGGKSHQPLDEA